MSRLNHNSHWLLAHLFELSPRGVATTNPLPADAPAGIHMPTVRGLEKRGFVREEKSHGHKIGIFTITDEGRAYMRKNPLAASLNREMLDMLKSWVKVVRRGDLGDFSPVMDELFDTEDLISRATKVKL